MISAPQSVRSAAQDSLEEVPNQLKRRRQSSKGGSVREESQLGTRLQYPQIEALAQSDLSCGTNPRQRRGQLCIVLNSATLRGILKHDAPAESVQLSSILES